MSRTDEERDRQDTRLERLIAIYYKKALEGQRSAGATLAKLLKMKSDLWGLDAPARTMTVGMQGSLADLPLPALREMARRLGLPVRDDEDGLPGAIEAPLPRLADPFGPEVQDAEIEAPGPSQGPGDAQPD